MAALTFETAQRALDDTRVAANPVTVDEVRKTADLSLALVVEDWPVDTRFSLDSWEVENEGRGAAIVNSADYASHVHSGLADALVTAATATLDHDTEERINERLAPMFEA